MVIIKHINDCVNDDNCYIKPRREVLNKTIPENNNNNSGKNI